MYCDKENVNILTSLLAAHGVRHVVVCPGSRNAPLAHNFNECPDITCHTMTDERAAAFFAIGIRQQTGSPAAVCVTSGSALLNTLPATAEATYQQQGLIIISADRPIQWIGQNDGQTMPQQGALGAFVAKSVTIPEPRNAEERWMCNRLVNEALMANAEPHRPSVHINVPISEPLFSFNVKHLPRERVITKISWHNKSDRKRIEEIFWQAERRMVIVGQTDNDCQLNYALEAASSMAVVLAEPLSCSYCQPAQTDLMLHAIETACTMPLPDCVIYIGGNTISKRVRQFMRKLTNGTVHINISEDGMVHDISMNTHFVIDHPAHDVLNHLCQPAPAVKAHTAFMAQWNKLQRDCKKLASSYNPPYSQMMAVKEFEENVADNAHAVYYANSMPVRLAAIYAKHYVYCNRGLNGIEGSLSVAVGAAATASLSGCKKNVYCVIGDLSFFYDENALWQNNMPENLRILLLNNGGGAIFGMLKGLDASPARHGIIDGQHTANAQGICRQFGLDYMHATDAPSLKKGIAAIAGKARGKATLLEVSTNTDIDNLAYAELYKLISIEMKQQG